MASPAQNAKRQQEQLEQRYLKGTRDEDLGVYCSLFSAKTGIEGQDGGVVTALLQKGFRTGLFDAAIVVRHMEGYTAEAVVAVNPQDAAAAKGTRYLRVNVTQKLRELIASGKRRVAVVCTPCEARVARRIADTMGKECEVTIIGLFCFEAFNRNRLKQELKAQLGVDLDKADRTEVRQGTFTVKVEGKEYSCGVKDLECASEAACRFCGDFTSELADVSVGSVGSEPGYSTVIVRSSAGEKLVQNLDAVKGSVDKREVARLAKFKRNRAEKSLAAQNKP